MKLNKMQKALADAEECIKCKPEWEKGYFRKANVLEATLKFDQVWREVVCQLLLSDLLGKPLA